MLDEEKTTKRHWMRKDNKQTLDQEKTTDTG